MARRKRPTIALCSASGTLRGVDPLLRRAGVRLVRITSVEPAPVDPTVWLPRLLRAPKPEIVVVTSRQAVGMGVHPWLRESGVDPTVLEFWAVGPGTAQALRELGVRRVRTPSTVGALALARAVGRAIPRRVVYFRSDAAGSRLARALRARGHSVTEPVVYRLRPGPPLTARARQALRAVDLLVISSPSGLSELRRRLDRPTFSHLLCAVRLVVLGARSRKAARAYGFRRVSVAPSTTAQPFTRYLLRELEHART